MTLLPLVVRSASLPAFASERSNGRRPEATTSCAYLREATSGSLSGASFDPSGRERMSREVRQA